MEIGHAFPDKARVADLRTENAKLRKSLERFAVRENGDWPRSRSCHICGSTMSTNIPLVHERDCVLNSEAK